MRILIRTSKWAIWARRFGSFALPVAIVPVFMHRERMISSETFHLIEGIAIALAATGLILALGAFVRLWISGDRGWGKALIGLVFSLLCLVPAAVVATGFVRYPMSTDTYTDIASPPALLSELPRPPMTTELAMGIAAAFPNAATRTYPLGPQQVFAIAEALATSWGWEVRFRREPQTPLDQGQLNAIALTLLGWRDEVAIRVTGVPEGSMVAMRSASLAGSHDLGANGRRIEDFLLALDNEITVLMRDNPAAAAPSEEPVAAVEEES